jgi:hypothetical protein
VTWSLCDHHPGFDLPSSHGDSLVRQNFAFAYGKIKARMTSCGARRRASHDVNGNCKIIKLLFAWGALALRVALQIIIIINKLGDFLP